MTTPDAPGADAHAANDHGFDGEPVRVLAADEPRTPGWLPALGGAIFVVAAVWFLAMSKGDDAGAAAAAEGSAPAPSASASAPAPPPAPAADHAARPSVPGGVQKVPVVRAGTPGAPPAPPASAIRKYTPEELDRLRKAVEDARGK